MKKQNSSSTCLVCGRDNPLGLKMHFYEVKEQYLIGIFEGKDHHNSYPNRMHGGIISAILDETIGRTVQIFEPNTFGVTSNLEISFKLPVPLNEKLFCICKLITNNRYYMIGEGIIVNDNNVCLALGKAKYVKMKPEKIASSFLNEQNWFLDEHIDPLSEKKIDSLIAKLEEELNK